MIWIKKLIPVLFFITLLSSFHNFYCKTITGENKHEPKLHDNTKFPLFSIRALHLELWKSIDKNGPVKQTKEYVTKNIVRASNIGFNVLILQVKGTIKLKQSPKFATKWAYSIEDIKEILAVAKDRGMDVIPEVKLLTHQDLLMLQINKDLMLNETTYDPNRPEVYEIIYPILIEIIEIFQPKYVHIGHDEVFGIQNYFKLQKKLRGKQILKAEDYLADVLKIYEFLKSRGVGTMMWADMLLDPHVFGNDYDGASVNGYQGYAALIKSIPKDVILCDWHYSGKSSEFPTYTYLQKQGFTVWGAVWKDPKNINAFSAYVAKYAQKGEGMIATTWWPFVIQDIKTIDLILETSSKAFFKENEK